jgi:tetratricopeptide (TPR) repeat protein
VRKITFLVLLAALLAIEGCSPGIADDPIAAEWRRVLDAKKEWRNAAQEDRVRAQQAYVDALAVFVRRHPDHPRGRQVYEEAELEFARMLAGRGEYDRAVEYYRSVLGTNPEHAEARAELDAAERRRFVTPEALGSLRVGMSPDEVRERLGQPLPGWSRSMRRGEAVIDSWYYRRRDGGVAGVFFQNGRLFAAEFEQPIRLPS